MFCYPTKKETLVYKKFAKRDGKKYGPYMYENKRVGEKVVTNYLGKGVERKNSVSLLIFVLLSSLIFIGLIVMFLNAGPTGKVLLDLGSKYSQGDQINGVIKFNLKAGELIPKDSLITVKLNNVSKQFPISDLVDSNTTSGNFYSEGSVISGNGDGYGVPGTKTVSPTIYFDLRLINSSSSSNSDNSSSSSNSQQSNSNSGNSSDNSSSSTQPIVNNSSSSDNSSSSSNSQQSNSNSGNSSDNSSSSDTSSSSTTTPSSTDSSTTTSSSTTPSTPAQPSSSDSSVTGNVAANPSSSSTTSSSSSTSAPSSTDSSTSSTQSSSSDSSVTGNVVNSGDDIITGKVSADSSFSYTLADGQKAEIVPGSLTIDGKSVNDSLINMKIVNGQVEVTTDYTTKEQGFGKDYLGDYASSLNININDLGVNASDGYFVVEMSYDGEVLASSQQDLSSIVSSNTTSNVSLEVIKDIPTIRLSPNSSYSIDLSQYFANADKYSFEASNISAVFDGNMLNLSADEGFKGARVGTITAYLGGKSISSNSFNILVSSGVIKIKTTHDEIKIGEPVTWTQNISLDTPEQIAVQIPSSAENVSVVKSSDNASENVSSVTSSMTGNVVVEIEVSNKTPGLFTLISKIFSAMTGHVVEDTANIQQDVPANTTKDVVINDSSANNYVVTYQTPGPTATQVNTSTGEEVTISTNVEGYTDVLSFANIPEVYNVGEENKIKIYWKQNNSYVPFDAYDLNGNGKLDYVEWNTPHLSNQTFEIILVSKAELLDSNRTYLDDVYDYVKSPDNNSINVPDGDYIRATFERNLTHGKDMTIYANGTGTINVYNQNSSTIIGQILVTENKTKYKIYPNYTNSNVYDLGFSGDINVDYIVDPSYPSDGTGIYDCGTVTDSGSYTLNNDIGSGGDCLFINANDVYIDGQGYTITGNVNGNGLNNGDNGFNFALNNIHVTGTISSNGGYANFYQVGGSGGTITLTSSTFGYVNVYGGNAGVYGSVGSIGQVYVDGNLAVLGCTDSTASNYNPSANVNDGSCIAVVSITSCETISSSGFYTLNNDIGSGGDCLIINGNDITVYGNNHTINGNVNGNGVNQGDNGFNFALDNMHVTGSISSNGQNYWGYGGYSGSGGTITLTNTVFGSVTVNPGSAPYSNSGSTGQIYIDGNLAVFGCTDSTALNYNPSADHNQDCIAKSYGCTDPNAFNYDSSANTDDGSCVARVYGCTNAQAVNYAPLANTDDGSCQVYGCTDPSAFNYNPSANNDDGSCIPTVYGCTDSTASNYNPSANVNDGSCIAVVSITSCETISSSGFYTLNNDIGSGGDCLIINGNDITVYGNNHTINGNVNGNGVNQGDNGFNFALDNMHVTGSISSNGQNYWGYGGYSGSGGTITLTNTVFGSVTVNPGSAPYSNSGSTGQIYIDGNLAVFGCMDSNAFNYNPSANHDDGSCTSSLVTSCETLTVVGTYYLQNDIGGGDCLIINGNGIVVNGNNHTVNGNVNGNGINQADNGYSFSLNNITVTGTISSNGQDNSGYSGYSGSGGTITLTNTVFGLVYVNPGSAPYSSTGSGGQVYIDGNLAVFGCMDSNAFNYNPSADHNQDCIAKSYGCTDPNAFNYDSSANTDDGSCVARVYGCTNAQAVNYAPLANTDDGSCQVYGCTDPSAFNYNPSANNDDGSCIPTVYGCTNSTAVNYNSGANTDDGSCIPSSITSCETLNTAGTYTLTQNIGTGGDCLIINANDIIVNGNNHTITGNVNGNGVNEGDSGYSFSLSNINVTGNISSNGQDNSGYSGYSGSGGTINLTNTVFGSVTANPGSAPYSNSGSAGQVYIDGNLAVYGCTDPTASNYNSGANVDDGSCVHPSISSCRTLSIAGTYTLTQNIGTGSDCLIINANDIIVNGNGYTITGNVNGNGINAGDNGYSFSLRNITVTGSVSSSGQWSGGNYGSTAGNGGTITITNANTGNLNANGGNGAGSNGNGGNGGIININSPSTYGFVTVTAGNGAQYGGSVGSIGQVYIDGTLAVLGCTDSRALNYNPSANVNDGICIAVVNGCTDSSAANYNPSANVNDNSCYYHPGCTDSSALNYNSSADHDDGSCIPSLISACITLTYPGNYNLTQNIGSGNDCLIINGNDIVVNGNGYTINGNVNGTGINSGDNGFNFGLNNITVIGDVNSNGQDNPDGTAGNAGIINVSNINAGNLQANGGNNFNSGIGGNGGIINVHSPSTYGSISVNAGNGGQYNDHPGASGQIYLDGTLSSVCSDSSASNYNHLGNCTYAPLNNYNITSCRTINASGSYTFSNNIVYSGTGSCLIINASNVNIDGSNYILRGDSGVGRVGTGISANNVNNLSINGLTLELLNDGMVLNSISNSNINNNIVGINGVSNNNGMILSGNSTGNIIDSNTITNNRNGISLENTAQGNTFLNNALSNNSLNEIADTGVGFNNLLYNNSYGQIESSLSNLNIKGNFVIGSGIVLNNNSVGVDINNIVFGLVNTSANVSIYSGNDYDGSYNSDWYGIAKNGLKCNDCNNDSAITGNMGFRVTSLNGIYSIGLAPNSKSEIPLNAGWNMFSLTLNDTTPGNSTVEIPVVAGWNLIGYSGNSSVDHSSLVFDNSSWRNATIADDVNYGLAYYNSTGTRARYQYAPYDDSNLRSEVGYWVYAQQAGTIKINGVSGASDTVGSYPISNLMVRNDTSGEIKTFNDAVSAGWVNSNIYYWDTTDSDYPDGVYKRVFSFSSLNSWQGYFIGSTYNNLTLLRQN